MFEITIADMTTGAAELLPDGRLLVQRWFVVRHRLTQAPDQVAMPNGLYQFAGRHGLDAYAYEPAAEKEE
ncbi:MAG: hypothetical protein ACYC5Y_05135 [Symbiobacteriia bacterium]